MEIVFGTRIRATNNGTCLCGLEFTAETDNGTWFCLVGIWQPRHTVRRVSLVGESQLQHTLEHGSLLFGNSQLQHRMDIVFWLGIQSYITQRVFVVVNSQLHHTIENGFLWFGVHWYKSQWKLSFGWEPIASTYSGTCFLCRGSTIAFDDEYLFRGVVKHRYDIQWKIFFFGWEFTTTAYNGFHWRGIHRSSKQWNTDLRLRMHGYIIQWDMISLVGHS